MHSLFSFLKGCAVALLFLATTASQAANLNILFLGDSGHHQPPARFAQLEPVLADRGITLSYTDKMSDLNREKLDQYAALVVYANIDNISDDQAASLLSYVADGNGFVPLHCATYCFRNNKDIVALMGAQFQRHGTGVFRTTFADDTKAADHPIMKGFGGFESWDETYVHHMHNEKNRTVLTYRVDSEGREPWTWVRTHGKGRVFYTAWGHDHRTFGNEGFHNLVERGIRWAAGADPSVAGEFLDDQAFPVPEMTTIANEIEKDFEYIDVGAKIPNYVKSNRWGEQGDLLTKMQKPLPAEKSIKHYTTPKGFHLELFVSEEQLAGKPIAMAWDERGRLWLCETMDYPNELQPDGEGRDRIEICEDTDGDWKADKFTTYADKLSIPTSIAFHRGGVIVQDATRTLYLRDTNGDDVADERKIMFSDWAMGDTHGGVSNFQYGHDNWIYAMQGYNNSTPKINGQPQQTFRNGFFRFQPDGSEIEFLRSTNNNTWGLGISEEGIVFGSTANHNPSTYMPIPNRYYESVRGWTPSLGLGSIADTFLFDPITDKIRQVDQFGGYTAGAGHALYTARNYPQEYWNRTAFVNGPTGHLVGTFVIKADGSDFKSTSPYNLVASDDEWSAPIMTEIGPDGNAWILDWYNYIIQHNPTPQGFKTGKGNAYESDLRDKRHGRVYRLVYDDAPAPKRTNLAGASPQQLVNTLKSPNLLWRRQAQRLLVERGKKDVVLALVPLVKDQEVDEIGLNTAAIHALWTLHGLGALDAKAKGRANGDDALVNAYAVDAAVAALKHPSAGVRRNAVQVLPHIAGATDALIAADLITDSDAQVRLMAFLALANLPPTEPAGEKIAHAALKPNNANDRWIPDAMTAAAANNGASFIRTLAAGDTPTEKVQSILQIVTEHYARSAPVATAAELVASLQSASPPVANAVIEGLARGWPSDKPAKFNATDEAAFGKVMERIEPANRGLLIKLVTGWGSEKFKDYAQTIVTDMLAQVDDANLNDDARIAAANQLVEFQPTDGKLVGALLERINPQLSPDVANGIIQSLSKSEAPDMGSRLLANLRSLAPSTRQKGLAVFLSRGDATGSLLDGLDQGTIQIAELSLDQKQALNAHPNKSLRDRAQKLLARGGALPNADRQKVLESLLSVTKETGDAAKGKLVFKDQCAKCHLHNGEGAKIGPDLTGMAVHPKEELLTHILDPSSSVEGNFRAYSVIMNDGRTLTGMLASESKTAIEIFDTEGKKKSVLREDIEELVASAKSMMPEGFEKQIKREGFVDLLEFLTKRGKFVPVDLRKAATLASDRGMFFDKSGGERMIFDDWTETKQFKGVPFQLIDPRDGTVPNVIMLNGPNGSIPPKMPKQVTTACNGPAKAIHLLSGVSGWGHMSGDANATVSMIVRLQYADGQQEDHELKNGIHFADYIRHINVPESEMAFDLKGKQIRYLAIYPKRPNDAIKNVEFVKGPDRTAPIVMAVTVESP